MVLLLLVLSIWVLSRPPKPLAEDVITPQKPRYVTHDEIVTITYDSPYKATVQYLISEKKTTTETEHLLLLLTKGWENEDIDCSIKRGMDTIGREYVAVARINEGRYEIRAYQNVGNEYFAYVTTFSEITEYSLEELYAGIENIIKSFEKNNREIQLF